jgi:hypothetical protein
MRGRSDDDTRQGAAMTRVWHWLLRRASFDLAQSYIEEMAATFPKFKP